MSDDKVDDNGDFFVSSPVRPPPYQDTSHPLVIGTEALTKRSIGDLWKMDMPEACCQ
jgi:hypothetical protein